MIRALLRELGIALLVAALALGAHLLVILALGGHPGPPSLLGHILRSAWNRDHALLAALVSFAVALSYPLRALRRLRGPDAAVRPLAALGLIPALLAVGLMGLRVEGVRREVLARFAASPDEAPCWILMRLEAESVALLLAGGGALLVLFSWAVAGVVAARRRATDRPALAAWVAAGAIGAGVAAAAVASAWARLTCSEGDGDPEIMRALRYQAFAEHGAPLVDARRWIVAVAVVASAAILGLTRRSGRPPAPIAPSARTAAAALFLVGLAAFASTRGAAQDADHPPPLWTPRARSSPRV